jgi:hypothetical protein
MADQLHVAEDDTAHYVADTNGLHLTPFDPDFDAVDRIQSLAAGDVTEDQLMEWIAGHPAPVAKNVRVPGASDSP